MNLRSAIPLFLLAAVGLPRFAQGEEPGSPRLTFSSQAKGNIFPADAGELLLQLTSPEPTTGGTVFLTDETGRSLGSLEIPPQAPELKIPLPGKGFYRLRARASFAGAAPVTIETTAAVIGPLLDDALRKQSCIGLWNVQGDRDLAVMAGAGWNRAMTTLKDLPMEFLEKEAPSPALAAPGKPPLEIGEFNYVGVISFGLPLWLLGPIPEDHKKGFANPFQPPKDWQALRELVKAFTAKHPRWSDFPPYFEVYNEPEWHWKGSSEDLVRFEATVADAIKEVRPDVKVLGPGFSSIRISDPARLDLETANRLKLFEHLDGIVVHAYVDGSPPEGEFIERVQALQAFLAQIGRPDFPIHLTEFGWCTKPGTWQRPVEEITQAEYVVRSLTLLAALGVENATYFCLLYKAAPNEGERSFSIVHDDLTPKPAYAAFSNVARWLAGTEGKGRWLRISPTTHLVIFRKPKQDVAVIWDTKGTRTISLPGLAARAEEMTGRPVSVSATGDLTISPSPIFLELVGDQFYAAPAETPLRVMRGNSVPLPEADDTRWMAPEPLAVRSGNLVAPVDSPEGSYLLLARSEAGWKLRPVEIIAPLAVAPARLAWSADEASPKLSATVRSHAPGAITSTPSVKLDGARTIFAPPATVEPSQTAEISIPLENLSMGKRYHGKFAVESREGPKRDRVEQPLDFTILATPAVQGPRPDWRVIPAIDFSAWDPFGTPLDAADCSATFQSGYDTRALYLRIRVRDDQPVQTATPENLWSQDSIQIGFDADAEKTWEANDLFGLKGHRVFEYGVAWTGNKAMNWRWISYSPELPVGMSDPRLGVLVRREGDVTDYELTFPWEMLGLKAAPRAGSAIGIALAVTDIDAKEGGRRGLRLFGGITDGKDAAKFGKLWLRPAEISRPPTPKLLK